MWIDAQPVASTRQKLDWVPEGVGSIVYFCRKDEHKPQPIRTETVLSVEEGDVTVPRASLTFFNSHPPMTRTFLDLIAYFFFR